MQLIKSTNFTSPPLHFVYLFIFCQDIHFLVCLFIYTFICPFADLCIYLFMHWLTHSFTLILIISVFVSVFILFSLTSSLRCSVNFLSIFVIFFIRLLPFPFCSAFINIYFTCIFKLCIYHIMHKYSMLHKFVCNIARNVVVYCSLCFFCVS